MGADIYYSNLRKSNSTYVEIPDNIDVNYIISGTLNHQNMIIRRELFEQHGYYNDTLRILGDTEFLLKEAWIHKSKFTHIKTAISIYDAYGISTKIAAEIMEPERKKMFVNVFGKLGESIFELYNYRTSLYGKIVNRYGYSRLLHILLRAYRFFAHRFNILLRRKP